MTREETMAYEVRVFLEEWKEWEKDSYGLRNYDDIFARWGKVLRSVDRLRAAVGGLGSEHGTVSSEESADADATMGPTVSGPAPAQHGRATSGPESVRPRPPKGEQP